MTNKLHGYAAIDYATEHGRTLSSYADPLYPAHDGLTVAEARAIASEDPGLIWIERGPEIEIWIDADRVVDGWGSALGARRVCVSRLSAPEREALERGALGLENAPPAGGRGRGSQYRRIVKVGPSWYARRFSPEAEALEGIAD